MWMLLIAVLLLTVLTAALWLYNRIRSAQAEAAFPPAGSFITVEGTRLHYIRKGEGTPVVLLRTIERVGMDNIGVNLDPANLIMYGKGNPVDALDVIGPYVRNVHVKDGLYPTNGDRLGHEVRVGEGKVNFPAFLSRLSDIGFAGELIIEREISGAEQDRDIRDTIRYLQEWFARQTPAAAGREPNVQGRGQT